MSETFDKNSLMDRVDGDTEFLEETIAMLDEDSPALLGQIQTAAAAGDAENLVQGRAGQLEIGLVSLEGDHQDVEVALPVGGERDPLSIRGELRLDVSLASLGLLDERPAPDVLEHDLGVGAVARGGEREPLTVGGDVSIEVPADPTVGFQAKLLEQTSPELGLEDPHFRGRDGFREIGSRGTGCEREAGRDDRETGKTEDPSREPHRFSRVPRRC